VVFSPRCPHMLKRERRQRMAPASQRDATSPSARRRSSSVARERGAWKVHGGMLIYARTRVPLWSDSDGRFRGNKEARVRR